MKWTLPLLGRFDRLSTFGVGAGGWSSNDTYPRRLADVNGDGNADHGVSVSGLAP
jgi:hypothetical protein